MKKEYIDYICALYGYLLRIQEIHWDPDCNAYHVRSDEFYDIVKDATDDFAECAMGLEGKKFPKGKLLPMLPNSMDFPGMLKELEKDTIDMRTKVNSTEEGRNSGLANVLDDFIQNINKYKYLTSFR